MGVSDVLLRDSSIFGGLQAQRVFPPGLYQVCRPSGAWEVEGVGRVRRGSIPIPALCLTSRQMLCLRQPDRLVAPHSTEPRGVEVRPCGHWVRLSVFRGLETPATRLRWFNEPTSCEAAAQPTTAFSQPLAGLLGCSLARCQQGLC